VVAAVVALVLLVTQMGAQVVGLVALVARAVRHQ
jgi:hypothetical protein